MSTFIDNIGLWISEHKIDIVAVFQILQSSGLITLIVIFIKDLIKAKIQNNTVAENNEAIQTVATEVSTMQTEQDVIVYKINALVEALSLVYSNLRNEETRQLVQNKLALAKSYTSEQKAKIVEQLENLQKTTEEVLKNSVEKVNEVLNSAKQTTEVITNIER